MYKDVDLLHQDISMGNLAFYKKGDEFIVILLDFDLATLASSAENASQRRTGTVPFMARDVLAAVCPGVVYKHSLRHDLESIFCIIIFYGLGYTAAGFRKGTTDWLKLWRTGSYIEIRNAKQSFIAENQPELLKHIEPQFLHGFVKALHGQYNSQILHLQSIQKQLDTERDARIEEEAQSAMNQAIEEGKNPREARRIYGDILGHLERTMPKEKVQESSAITFKQWMIGAKRKVSKVHEGCTCCN